MKDYEINYESKWKRILEDENGRLNLDQVKRELFDYNVLLNEVPKVYEELSGLSKPHTSARAILQRVHERYIDRQDTIDDFEMMADNGVVTIESIREYLRK